jgi:hypothetical protein
MKTSLTLILAGALACGPACADTIGSAVTLEIRSDGRGSLPLYPAPGAGQGPRAYAEAERGAGYRLVVHNNLDRRVGLVLAVDGRNIISGSKSWLNNDERMYILEPGETQEYTGWRTAQDQVHQFFFTSAEDSYAGAFNDTSAMGVVAMAVYREYQPPRPPRLTDRLFKEGAREAAPGVRPQAKALGEAGTGYGPEAYSPSISVSFHPEVRCWEKSLIKYEWRETLLRMGVIRNLPGRGNRLWDQGFAPPPPPRM